MRTPRGELNEDVHVFISSSTGGVDRPFLKGELPSPLDATIELNGMISDFPWDHHTGALNMQVVGPKVNGVWQTIPTKVTFVGLLAGVAIDANFAKDPDPNAIDIKLGVSRSTIVKTVVIFSMILLWILTATVVSMVVAVLVGNRIEMVMFPFIGTILFSMVAFRNALPGAPPIGALSDYMAFFWGYAFCVLALLALTITWLRRLPRKRRADDGEDVSPPR